MDFYRVRANQPSGTSSGVLTVSVVGTGSAAIDPVVQIFDRNLVLQSLTVLTHDANEFTVQIPDTEANRDYFISVSHGTRSVDAAGNYTLGMDFGGPLEPLRTLATGTLTSAAPANLSRIEVLAGQVLHVLLAVDPATDPGAVRMSIFDAANNTIDSRLANAGETTSLNAFLPAGTYQFLVGGGATGGTAMPSLHYTILGLSLSDPIGPQAVAPGVPPPPPPPATVTTPHPVTPTIPVTPTSPNILLVPPTDLPTPPTLLLKPVVAPPAKTFSVGGSSVPRVTQMRPGYPNPFKGAITFALDLSSAREARLEIYDLRGARVCALMQGVQSAGRYLVTWDGKDNAGRQVANGVYLVRVEAGAYRAMHKAVLVR